MIIYGLMKFIEQIPERYDRMIGFLTFGGHVSARNQILSIVKPGTRILDIGCGTGTFLIQAACKGAICTGVDVSNSMLRVFKKKISDDSLESKISILNQSATLLRKSLPGQKFDIISLSLVLGEMPSIVQNAVLGQLPALLSPSGKVMICDELWPSSAIRSFLYSVILAITFVPNFILTRTLIRPIKGIEEKLEKAGFCIKSQNQFAFGVVTLIEAEVRHDP